MIHYNTDEPWKHYVSRRSQSQNIIRHIRSFLHNVQNGYPEERLLGEVVARGARNVTARSHRDSSGDSVC
jgi:DNA phosphorothioation-dependent restriction protein DptG